MAIQRVGRTRTDGHRAKVGTSREGGGSGGSTYVQIYSVLFIAPPPASLDHLKNQTGAAREREKGIENNGRSIPGAIGRRSLVGCQSQEQARITDSDESRRPIHKGKSERVFDAQVKRGERSEIWRGTENKRWEAAASFLPHCA